MEAWFYRTDGVNVTFMEIYGTDYPIMPMLRTLHMFPNMMKTMTADKGAIKHIFSGSDCYAPGLTSPGGNVTPDLEEQQLIALHAEGKQHAMAIGVLLMSSEEITTKGKGNAIEVIQYLEDGLW